MVTSAPSASARHRWGRRRLEALGQDQRRGLLERRVAIALAAGRLGVARQERRAVKHVALTTVLPGGEVGAFELHRVDQRGPHALEDRVGRAIVRERVAGRGQRVGVGVATSMDEALDRPLHAHLQEPEGHHGHGHRQQQDTGRGVFAHHPRHQRNQGQVAHGDGEGQHAVDQPATQDDAQIEEAMAQDRVADQQRKDREEERVEAEGPVW